jgi:hypothetical protein
MMEIQTIMMEILNWIFLNGMNMLSAVIAVLSSLVVLCLMIPGEQPEKFLQSVVDLLTKFSRK